MVYMGNNVVDRGRHRHHRHHHQEQQHQHHHRHQHLLHHNHSNNKPRLDEKDSRFDSNHFYWDDNQAVVDNNIDPVDPALYLSVVGKPLLYSTGTPPESDLLFTNKSDANNLLLSSPFDNNIYINKTPTNDRVDAATQVSDFPKTICDEQCKNDYQVSMLSQAIRLSSPCCVTMGNRRELRGLFHLKPLGNQVGGHTRLMVLSSKSGQSTDSSSLTNLDLDVGQMIVCKPLNMGELQFYLKLEEQNRRNRSLKKYNESDDCGRVRSRRNRDLSEFVPQFEGVMALSQDDVNVTVQGRNAQMLYCRSCSDDKSNRIDEFQTARLMTLPDPSSTSDKQLFLLLENLTSKRKYKLPCILDLKMGVRQYSECATMQKRLRQTLKCRMTTSATLGVRLCGMQIYQGCCGTGDNRNAYSLLKRDKYWGRRLDVDGFERALKLFFSKSTASSDLDDENEDGDISVDSYRLDVVKGVLRRLGHLRNAIMKNAAATTSDSSQVPSSRALRFYSCSLLIVYEGVPSSFGPPKTRIPMQRQEQPKVEDIDDGHSNESHDSSSSPINHMVNNVRSRNTSITTTKNDELSDIDQRRRHRCSSSLCYCTPPASYSDSNFPWSDDVDSEEDGRGYSSSGCSSSSEDDSDSEDDDDTTSSRSADTTPYDVRIIDFANASFFSRDNPSAVVPDTDDTAQCECSRDGDRSEKSADPCSPDTGFLQGLRTVRRVLSQILKDSSHHK